MLSPSNVTQTLTLSWIPQQTNIYNDLGELLAVCDSLVPKSKHDFHLRLDLN
jgi:hypothetical protein